MRRTWRALLLIFVFDSSELRSESLHEFSRECDPAVGLSVPAFDCSQGTDVPLTHLQLVPGEGEPSLMCDEPNRLNTECDPGSEFQVLLQNADAFVVAHCRNRGGPANRTYKDIAVIQHNRTNGATCFYQALDEDDRTPPRTGLARLT